MNESKNKILSAIRNNKMIGVCGHPEISLFQKGRKTVLLEDFKNNLLWNGCKWFEIASPAEAQQKINELFPQARVICSATKEIQGSKDLNSIKHPHDLEDVDVGIIRAQFGVSENGMVWMMDKDMGTPALGFLAEHLIILLKPNQLVRNMHEAYMRLRVNGNNYGCFMMGPSATGDIGMHLIHGAHGARSLTVFFM